MKKFLFVIMLTLMSCAANNPDFCDDCVANDSYFNDPDFCDGCDEKAINEKILQMKELYPEDKTCIFIADKDGKKTFTRYKIEHSRIDYKYGIKLINITDNSTKFYGYSDIPKDKDNKLACPINKPLEQLVAEGEAVLAKKRDVFGTLYYFDEHYKVINPADKSIEFGGHNEGYIKPFIINTSKNLNVKKECLFRQYGHYLNTDDECIIERRKAPKSKISYFNYEKYLPKNSAIKSEDDFINLYTIYNYLREYNMDNKYYIGEDVAKEYCSRKCCKLEELTTKEIEKCKQDEKDFIINFAMGKAQKCSVKYPEKYKKARYYNDLLDQWIEGRFWLYNLCIPNKFPKTYP